MLYHEIAPSPDLAPYVRCLWMLEDQESNGSKPLQKVMPDACPELLIHYGDRFRIREKGKIRLQPHAFLFGPTSRHIEIGPSGSTGMVSLRFYPGALSAFIPFSVKDITNCYIPLNKAFGRGTRALEVAVRGASSVEERFQLLESFLRSRLQAAKSFVPVLKQQTLKHITDQQHPVKIEELSKQLNIGRRHLERKFNEQFGMTPRQFLKIVRFQNIFKIIGSKRVKNLTDLTYRAGYFDQSHFYRDFKEFASMSPKEYFKEDGELTKLFVASL